MSNPASGGPADTWKSVRVQNPSMPGGQSLLPSGGNSPMMTTTGGSNQFMRTVNSQASPRGPPINQGPRFSFQNTSMNSINPTLNHSDSFQSMTKSNTQSPQSSLPRGGPPPPSRNAHTATRVEFTQPKLNIIHDPKLLPTPTLLSAVDPVRDFSQPGHKFPARKVDSRSEAKVAPEFRQTVASSPRGIPNFVGTTFTHLPNHFIPRSSLPPGATVPRMYPSLTGDEYSNAGMLLNNRTASGRILGNVAQRIISDAHVPYLPPEDPVGPDNPYVTINDTWTKCWDKEAGAVYYYNQLTGEATWIAPEL